MGQWLQDKLIAASYRQAPLEVLARVLSQPAKPDTSSPGGTHRSPQTLLGHQNWRRVRPTPGSPNGPPPPPRQVAHTGARGVHTTQHTPPWPTLQSLPDAFGRRVQTPSMVLRPFPVSRLPTQHHLFLLPPRPSPPVWTHLAISYLQCRT